MNKYIIFSLIGLAVITLSAGTAFAYKGDTARANFASKDWQVKHEEMQEQRADMQEIFANQDYAAWKALMEEKATHMQDRVDEMRANVSEENFAKLSEIHALIEAGDYEAAKELREELGFGGNRHKMGKFGGHMPRNIGR
jgi:hypothetical protein